MGRANGHVSTSAPKANDKAYNAALKSLPDKPKADTPGRVHAEVMRRGVKRISLRLGEKRPSPHFFPDDFVKHKRSGPFTYDTDRNSNDCIYEAQQWLLPSILGVASRNDHDYSSCNCRQANLVASP
jgi:hypothetical protein